MSTPKGGMWTARLGIHSWHTAYLAYIDPLFPVIKEQQGAQVLPLLQHWIQHGEMQALKQYCVC